MSVTHGPGHESKAVRRLHVWGRGLLALLALWATVSSVAAFLAITADTRARPADWLGAWGTLFACAAVFVVARVALLWVAEDLADRQRRRQHQQAVAAQQLRDRRQLPREIEAD